MIEAREKHKPREFLQKVLEVQQRLNTGGFIQTDSKPCRRPEATELPPGTGGSFDRTVCSMTSQVSGKMRECPSTLWSK